MEMFIIKKLLKDRGISVQQLADELKIHRTNLYSSINGNPTLSRLVEIANILKVDVVDLFAKGSEKQNELNGYIEYKEEIYKITCLNDLEDLLKIIK